MFYIRNSFHRTIYKVLIKKEMLIVFFYSPSSFQVRSGLESLADEINQAAFRSGVGPFAEVGGLEPSAEVEGGNDYFDINNAKSIQDIKSMKELKDIQEITAMKEIKSIDEIPDEIAEKFISVIIC